MGELEAAADRAGHSFAAMMERAGAAAARSLLRYVSFSKEASATHGVASVGKDEVGGRRASHSLGAGLRVLVLAGPGNNGGDALVCARYLAGLGVDLRVYLWKRETDAEDDYAGHFAQLTQLGVKLGNGALHRDSDADGAQLDAWLDWANVVVDGLLGTGANRPVEGDLAALLDSVNAVQQRAAREDAPAFVVALDCPSGLHCDNGALDPHAVPADLTVTFAHPKRGHLLFPGAGAVGTLDVVDIGLGEALSDDEHATLTAPPTFVLSAEAVRPALPARSANSHKGSFGKTMTVVGNVRFPGAALLSTAAAGHAGAGLLTGAVPRSVQPMVAGQLAPATWLPLDEEAGAVAESAAQQVLDGLVDYDALLIGCGLGRTAATARFLRTLLTAEPDARPPTVIDADGLNLLAEMNSDVDSAWWTLLDAQTVLTPHPAELARLCAIEPSEAVARRWSLTREKAAEWGVVLLTKGPYTLIAEPSGRMAVLPIATAALATAGTGDVLAGTIAGLLSQGLSAFDAACAGAWIHGCAGERCAAEIGTAGVLASDLLPRLAPVLNELRAGK